MQKILESGAAERNSISNKAEPYFQCPSADNPTSLASSDWRLYARFLRSFADGLAWMISVGKERNVERDRSMHEENRREGQETGGIICKTDKKTQILGT